MVFPASTALDAHASAELKTRLELILRLANAGVLVLVDRGKPEQLGTFVRTVLHVEERLDVLTSAYGLTRVDAGSCIILVPNVHEVAWMNQERPLLAQRRLRVLLYCDKAEAAKIAHGAPDFFHWISHWMEAPTGVWPPAVLGLRAAAHRNAPIAWEGGDFDAAFVAALCEIKRGIKREIKRVPISASMPYADLVRSFEQELEWIVLTNVDGPFRRRRVYWAMAESGRQGKVVVLDPAGHIDGFARVTATPMALKGAETRLAEANAKHAGRLAANLDCETEAIDVAVRLLSNGVSENDCVAVWRDEDPGVAVVRMAEHRGIEVPDDAPCVVRAQRAGKDVPGIGNFVIAATDAVDAGDFEVAERFARAAIASGETGVDISILLGHILIAQHAAAEAIQELAPFIAIEVRARILRRSRGAPLFEPAKRASSGNASVAESGADRSGNSGKRGQHFPSPDERACRKPRALSS